MTDIAEVDREWRALLAWRDAVAELRAGNAALVAALVRDSAVPVAVRAELADALEAVKLASPRNANKRKLDATERRELSAKWDSAQRSLDSMQNTLQADGRLEPCEVREILKNARAGIIADLAHMYGVSTDTVRKLK